MTQSRTENKPPLMPLLIGISGKKGHGKDTVCDSIMELITDRTVRRFSFADGLKEEIAKQFGVTISFINQNKELFRPTMQAVGMLRRSLNGDDYWICKCWEKLLKEAFDIAVITDVRLPNEYKYIKECGGEIWRVERYEGPTEYHKTLKEGMDAHISEVALDNHLFDHYLKNDSTLVRLKEEVNLALQMRKFIP